MTDAASAGPDLRIADLPVTNPRTSEWRFADPPDPGTFTPTTPTRRTDPSGQGCGDGSSRSTSFVLARPKTGVLRALHVDRSHTTTANSRNPGRKISRSLTT